MKKLTLLIILAFIFQATVSSQSCLPEGITFTTQEQIDSFQSNYPGCTEIEGDVTIFGSSIYNLDSLYVLTSISGTLLIRNSYNLTNLNGLHNLYSVGGDFHIKNKHNLTNFEGLGNLYSIGGDFDIKDNWDLTNFEGLSSLYSVAGDFTIEDNYYLINFEGISSLSSISGNLKIEDNYHLTSLTGLDNVNPVSIQNMNITLNNSLSTCHIESICQYLASPNGNITIYLNAEGCNSPPQIAGNCGNTMPCLPYGDYYFFTQSEIDDFQINYPGCTEIDGDVEISGSDITNLNGLNVLTAIAGELLIEDNSSLEDLTGLESLTTIGWNLSIGSGYQNYQALTSLTGLNNLTSIGGSLSIVKNENLTNLLALNNLTLYVGYVSIYSNNMLTDLTGLEGITGVYQLYIYDNASLLSLAGLDNITSGGYMLTISNNNALSSIENLGNLQSLEWLYITDNPALTSLSGLENLSFAYALSISNNDALTSLSCLNNLSSANMIAIKDNDALTSLSGLDNIEPETLYNLHIKNNNVLSTCHIQSICDYLISPNGIIVIQNNAPGCNSPEEVEDACWSKTDEFVDNRNDIQIFPNPAKKTIFLLSSSEAKIKEVTIYSQTGQKVLHKKPITHTIDISMLRQGMYIIELVTNESKIREKLIIK